ncbi:hypothetical protein ACFQ40_00150 [Kroppenstedtia eburnea]|uniref:hypothetical protein n=1 Tax=Kroppenstedtia eburnea TaxID=714067 RepID=UPI0036278336
MNIRRDCEKIKADYKRHGVEITLEDAERIWERYSEEEYLTSWLSVSSGIGTYEETKEYWRQVGETPKQK